MKYILFLVLVASVLSHPKITCGSVVTEDLIPESVGQWLFNGKDISTEERLVWIKEMSVIVAERVEEDKNHVDLKKASAFLRKVAERKNIQHITSEKEVNWALRCLFVMCDSDSKDAFIDNVGFTRVLGNGRNLNFVLAWRHRFSDKYVVADSVKGDLKAIWAL